MSQKVSDIKDQTPNPSLVEQLELLLAEAKGGKIRSLISVCGWDDDSVTHGWALDPRNTRRRLVAELHLLDTDFALDALNDSDSKFANILDSMYEI